MEIKEIQEKRLSLELDIAEKIRNFERETGLCVTVIALEHRSRETRINSERDSRLARVPVEILGIRCARVDVDLNARLVLPRPEDKVEVTGTLSVKPGS